VEYLDEGSAGVAKDALHNYKLDGENKIKVFIFVAIWMSRANTFADHVRQEVASTYQLLHRFSVYHSVIISWTTSFTRSNAIECSGSKSFTDHKDIDLH
jgi:hypothetical protein